MPMDSESLLSPAHLYSRGEVLARPSPVPKAPGVYAWFFREIPPGFPTDNCVRHDGKTLLYVGISPSAPPANGKAPAFSEASLPKGKRASPAIASSNFLAASL